MSKNKKSNDLLKQSGWKKCPICNYYYSEPSALSRTDNKTKICQDCGTKQAIKAFDKWLLNPERKTIEEYI